MTQDNWSYHGKYAASVAFHAHHVKAKNGGIRHKDELAEMDVVGLIKFRSKTAFLGRDCGIYNDDGVDMTSEEYHDN